MRNQYLLKILALCLVFSPLSALADDVNVTIDPKDLPNNYQVSFNNSSPSISNITPGIALPFTTENVYTNDYQIQFDPSYDGSGSGDIGGATVTLTFLITSPSSTSGTPCTINFPITVGYDGDPIQYGISLGNSQISCEQNSNYTLDISRATLDPNTYYIKASE